MPKYIWQRSNWTSFDWCAEELLALLGRARRQQGILLAEADRMGLEEQATILTEEAVKTSAIEGAHLDRDVVRSSVARRLGLPTAGLPAVERHADGLVAVLIDATRNHEQQLHADRIKSWHAALFPTGYSGMIPITVADWRKSSNPMQVVSGPIGKEHVHYEAPPSKKVVREMKDFLVWWADSPNVLDGLIRAAMAHFWFVTIHPFDDGNGRLARAITDMALAQDESSGRRLYSMSAQIMEERKVYYRVLEKTQRGNGDITEWLVWFLECFERAVLSSQEIVKRTVRAAQFWQDIAHIFLNDRQRKVLAKLIAAEPDGFRGGLTNRKYVSMTKTSRETAKRDIADLVQKNILIRNPGSGRSTSYRLVVSTAQFSPQPHNASRPKT